MKLLMVEDDDRLATTLRRGLEAEGFTVDHERDGVDGLWRALNGRYDVIVLDIMLPGRNGYLICSDLRARGIRTPILMLTAKGGELDEAEGLDTGADDYLTKPFSFTVLVARLRALHRRISESRPAPTDVGALRVDSAAQRAWLRGGEVTLTGREFDVLEYLVRRAGVAVSKSQLLAGVWSDDFEGDPNIVEVYVGRLRRKLDRDPEAGVMITTVRGKGYRLEAPG